MGITNFKKQNLKKNGFTLVELTVSMGILALIVGLTAGVLISVVKSYQKQKILNEIERNGDFIVRTLEESLRGATDISCIEFDGDVVPADGSGVTSCILGSNGPTPGRLLVVNRLDTMYFGRGMGSSPSFASCDGTESCYAYVLDTPTHINGSGHLTNESTKITDATGTSGVNVDRFNVSISGGDTTGAPYNITVTIDIKGPVGSSWEGETRTFQSFLTLRGSY